MVLVRIQTQQQMLALAYLVKCHTVNVENRVRDPESTERILNNEQGMMKLKRME
jgi:hypothetical protein